MKQLQRCLLLVLAGAAIGDVSGQVERCPDANSLTANDAEGLYFYAGGHPNYQIIHNRPLRSYFVKLGEYFGPDGRFECISYRNLERKNSLGIIEEASELEIRDHELDRIYVVVINQKTILSDQCNWKQNGPDRVEPEVAEQFATQSSQPEE